MSAARNYESVIGLEIHIQLTTASKAFSADAAAYGAAPNTQVSPVSMGHPGTLPMINRKMIRQAVMLGLATRCRINKVNHFARKNYFYADIPKGYQITQFSTPICTGGYITIKAGGEEKRIGITRIHMEEDSGKSIHDQDPWFTLVDLNRAGVPLLEMVSEPEMRSPEEAYQFVGEVRKLVRYLDICDGNMEEGSLRCDANVSVRPAGSAAFGGKVEVKNMNSMRNVKRALEFEIARQVELIEKGSRISQDTMGFDAVTGRTFPMRSKEMAHDYRYFPEPDLPPVILSEKEIRKTGELMPTLPEEMMRRLTENMGLSLYDAAVITENKEEALYFEELARHTSHFKAAANWMMGPVKSYLHENGVVNFPLAPAKLAELVNLVEEGKVNNLSAKQKLLPALLEKPEAGAEALALKMNLMQSSDVNSITDLANRVVAMYPEKVKAYKNGQKGILGLFMGEIMKLSNGSADPKAASKILIETLNKS